ncbi:MAG: hypothetical protein BWK72_17915 [Rhodoferax ferrireducens]|uniref:Uncharacterized protein n=1 Tax=Rhodoferax ferrireducens TaxID=192843 RepID=A0A1W9KQ99_9BURK|nr:MAG: hypothetical protein BWK72_17915 [Rhodoferax ferrireducens]
MLARKTVHCDASETDPKVTAKNYATLLTSPELAAYRVIASNEHKDMHAQLDVPTLVQTLKDQGAAANRNDLSQAEAMLMNQATALQSLFARLAERATGAEYMPNFEIFMRVALKAQSQCRATLETLAAIKNPPIVYAKQANVTTGPQQVNNVTHTGRKQNQSIELLEQSNGNYLDSGAPGASIGLDPAMATVGTVNRAA